MWNSVQNIAARRRSESASVLAVSTDADTLAAALTGGVPLAPGFDRRTLTALGPRKWLKVDENGEASIMEARPCLGCLGEFRAAGVR